ncbi:hypothetical protein CN212_23815 [Sinorhizobium meliloti]|nr:hypothetical protein CN220_33725 [Sinorhizobium meliloti]RVH45109.1 hypothetical protein CN212_23815 [Sinorhizobium meliloti]
MKELGRRTNAPVPVCWSVRHKRLRRRMVCSAPATGGKRNLFRQAQEQVRTNRRFNALSLVDSAFNCVL